MVTDHHRHLMIDHCQSHHKFQEPVGAIWVGSSNHLLAGSTLALLQPIPASAAPKSSLSASTYQLRAVTLSSASSTKPSQSLSPSQISTAQVYRHFVHHSQGPQCNHTIPIKIHRLIFHHSRGLVIKKNSSQQHSVSK